MTTNNEGVTVEAATYAELRDALGEAIGNFFGGRLVSVGAMKNVYDAQVYVKDVIRWHDVLVRARVHPTQRGTVEIASQIAEEITDEMKPFITEDPHRRHYALDRLAGRIEGEVTTAIDRREREVWEKAIKAAETFGDGRAAYFSRKMREAEDRKDTATEDYCCDRACDIRDDFQLLIAALLAARDEKKSVNEEVEPI